MKKLVVAATAALLLFLSVAANAALVLKDTAGNVVRLTDAPCVHETVLKHVHEAVQEQYVSRYKAGSLLWEGKSFAACYVILNETVFLIDEAGDKLNGFEGIPLSAFSEDTL